MNHLTFSDRKKIKKLSKEGLTVKAIVERVGFSRSLIYHVLQEAGVEGGKWGIGKAYRDLQRRKI